MPRSVLFFHDNAVEHGLQVLPVSVQVFPAQFRLLRQLGFGQPGLFVLPGKLIDTFDLFRIHFCTLSGAVV